MGFVSSSKAIASPFTSILPLPLPIASLPARTPGLRRRFTMADNTTLMQQQQAVGAFWQWWGEKGATALAEMFRGAPRQEEILHELNALISQIAPNLVFEFASGDSAGLDSEFLFILTAEGVGEYRAPARRWLLHLPHHSRRR